MSGDAAGEGGEASSSHNYDYVGIRIYLQYAGSGERPRFVPGKDAGTHARAGTKEATNFAWGYEVVIV